MSCELNLPRRTWAIATPELLRGITGSSSLEIYPVSDKPSEYLDGDSPFQALMDEMLSGGASTHHGVYIHHDSEGIVDPTTDSESDGVIIDVNVVDVIRIVDIAVRHKGVFHLLYDSDDITNIEISCARDECEKRGITLDVG
jgi:hypothetical protein